MAWRWTRSLTGRLLLLLFLVQAGVPILGMAAWMLFSPYVAWTDVAAASARRHVTTALRRDADGGFRIEATPELAAYAAARPGFAYAVFRNGQALDGSDPTLAAVLAPLGSLLPTEGQLAVPLPGGRRTAQFDAGTDEQAGLTFVTAGDAFHTDDLQGFVSSYLPALVPIFGPSCLVAGLAVPLVIRRAMRPLRAAAAEAGRIEFSNLSQRLPENGVPAEAAPLVKAVNAALDRLADGAARQRLFHANAAHELRTPVAILQARLDALPGLPRGHELRRDVARIARLVEQLLAVERLGACGLGACGLGACGLGACGLGACGLGEEQVDLITRVKAVVADFAPLAIHSGRDLAFEPASDSVIVHGNGRALDSAVANIIDNALRAEPEGGCVQVRVGPGALVVVEDHGAGVPPAERGLVFEPFWRKDERPPGTGLGLSIVREVARLHGGDVEVTETPGGGATFRLRLPEPAAPP
jgi:signal transduction histidine kinase